MPTSQFELNKSTKRMRGAKPSRLYQFQILQNLLSQTVPIL